MLSALKRALLRYRDEGQEEVQTPQDVDALFILQYGQLDVGYLSLHEGVWEFRYSDEFRGQTEIQPIVDFPEVEKVYNAESLWPFFLTRIPSIAQPSVRRTIEAEGLDEKSDVELLKRFGERAISNPFKLIPTQRVA